MLDNNFLWIDRVFERDSKAYIGSAAYGVRRTPAVAYIMPGFECLDGWLSVVFLKAQYTIEDSLVDWERDRFGG